MSKEPQTTKGCAPDNAAENSPHILRSGAAEGETWYWQNGGWAKKPNSPWITNAVPMQVIGWKYVRPL